MVYRKKHQSCHTSLKAAAEEESLLRYQQADHQKTHAQCVEQMTVPDHAQSDSPSPSVSSENEKRDLHINRLLQGCQSKVSEWQ